MGDWLINQIVKDPRWTPGALMFAKHWRAKLPRWPLNQSWSLMERVAKKAGWSTADECLLFAAGFKTHDKWRTAGSVPPHFAVQLLGHEALLDGTEEQLIPIHFAVGASHD